MAIKTEYVNKLSAILLLDWFRVSHLLTNNSKRLQEEENKWLGSTVR